MDRYSRLQATIEKPAAVEGYGFWSGLDARIEFRPAPPNSGITFVRADLPDKPMVPAQVRHRVQGPRRTTLVHNGCAIELVEHVLAALAGMQIDNCQIWVDRPEIPGCDGSSKPFVDALLKAGRANQQTTRPATIVRDTIRVGDDECWILAEPNPEPEFHLTYELEYECTALGKQSYSTTVTPETFMDQVAPARTFLLKSEADALQGQGLGRRVTYQDVLVFDEEAGLLDNELRFQDECARHKLLDVIGDFALLGTDVIGKFTAHRSGHYLNSQMVFALLQQNEMTVPVRKSA